MALNFHELADSRPVERTFQSASVTRRWIALHSLNESAVYTALLALVAPVRYDNLRRSKVGLTPKGGGVWYCEVEYAWQATTQGSSDTPPNPDPQAPLGAEWSFDSSVGTVHITQSLKTVAKKGRKKPGGGEFDAPDYKQAIGVTTDAVAGVDVPCPKLEVSLTLTYPFVTLERIKLWSKLGGRTNKAAFLAWERGECMYLGGPTNVQPGQLVKATHKWSAGRNLKDPADRADLTITPGPGGLVLPQKGAHHYVWCAYENNVDAQFGIQIPRAAYVEQTQPEGDFSVIFSGA